MSPVLAVVVVVLVDVAAIATMMAVRRRAPSGSFFKDTAQAAGVFTVAGAAFAVLVAFVFLLAFQSYDAARSSAQDEATAVARMFHASELLSPPGREALQGELICYGRAVAQDEWDTMRDGRQSGLVRGWLRRIDRTFVGVRPRTASQGAAFSDWMDQGSDREIGRRGRLAEAEPLVPWLVWVFLVAGGVIVVTFTAFFADSRERRLSQAMLMLAVSTMVTSSLLVIAFLDRPYHSDSIKPSAMETTLAEVEPRDPGDPPCDGNGRPRGA
jgi:hypothetical protein